MDNSESRSFTPPWMLLAVLALGGVAFFGKKPALDIDRPQSPPLADGIVQSPPSVAAHRWEDPLQTALTDRSKRAGTPSPDSTIAAVWKAVPPQDRARLLILPVFIDSGPFPESEEARIRTRYATLSALSTAGYLPVDGDVLRYFVAKIPVTDLDREPKEIVIPYELYTNPDVGEKDAAPGTLLALWLGEGLLGRQPLHAVRDILKLLPPAGRAVRLVGPTSSSTLETLQEEAEADDLRDDLRGWVLFSDRATVVKYHGKATTEKIRKAITQQIETPMQMQMPKEPAPSPRDLEKDPLGLRPKPFRIERTIGTDVELGIELVRELKYRDALPSDRACRTVILSEWDSVYATTWRQILKIAIPLVAGEGGSPTAGDPLENVYFYTYLRGVDGKGAPADGKKPSDLPEGFAQIDYVRRIDTQLAALRDQVGRITAIGVMGSDLYDKIVLLKALRKTFPDAIFFTSDLDARYLHPREWDWAHNLVIGSHFGLTLNRDLQPTVPPFRDSYQTSTYFATLKAVGFQKAVDLSAPPEPLIFEVGRDRAFPMVKPPDKSAHPPVGRGGHYLAPLLSFVSFLIALLVVFLFLLRHSVRHDAIPDAYDPMLWRSFGLCVALLLGLMVAVIIDAQRGGAGEPFSVTGGISVWPTELVRFLVIGLCLAALRIFPRALDDNRSRLEAEHPSLIRPEGEAAAAWGCYLASSEVRAWIPRLACWALPFLVAAVVLFAQDAFPRRPIRGRVAGLVDWSFAGFTVLLINVLLWKVSDAMLMCRRWVADLLRDGLRWPEADRRAAVRSEAALTPSADRMLSLRLVADRSEIVGRLVFYPFLLMSLMVLARTEIFDAWSWNLPLAIYFGALPAVCLATVLMLRRAAERARASALEQVQRDRLTATSDEVRSSLEEIERQIASLRRGAFVPLQENPVVASLLIPFSGIGAVEVLKFWL